MARWRRHLVLGVTLVALAACGPQAPADDDNPGCEVDNGGCDPTATCTDTAGTIVCDCPTGFETSDDGVTCDDINECDEDPSPCGPNSSCFPSPTPGEPPTCGCEEGYLIDPDTMRCVCDEAGASELPYLWVSNSPQGTVSKIDTAGVVELARYTTGPVGRQDPSRTSVSLDGLHMVVVNREGGITMIAANLSDCVDANMNGTIETSSGPFDVLAWGTDECVLWNRDLPGTGDQGPRPVAWTLVDIDQQTCRFERGNVWVGWYDGSTGHFALLDGTTGATIDQISTPWTGGSWGPYGGAIDSANNFWVVGHGTTGPIIKIDAITHAVTNYPNLGGRFFYGMGLAPDESVVVGGCDGNIYHFDPVTESYYPPVLTGGCLRGLQVDPEGRAWIAKNNPCSLVEYDTETRTITTPQIALPGCSVPVGVSVDQDGFVWVIDEGASIAFKVDPDTFATEQVTGLVSPYTYSDMIGTALRLQAPIID